MMSKKEPERRGSPLTTHKPPASEGEGVANDTEATTAHIGQGTANGIDRHVQRTYERAISKSYGGARKDYKVNLPIALAKAIKMECKSLTGHERGGWSDLVTVLLEHGWKAYQEGKIEVATRSVVVSRRIIRVENDQH